MVLHCMQQVISALNSKNAILIFPDKEKQKEPLYAIWKERKQRWYITKIEEGEQMK